MKVSEVLKVLEKTMTDLKAMPQDLECLVVDCPDGCYTGDVEDAPYHIEVTKEEFVAGLADEIVVMNMHR